MSEMDLMEMGGKCNDDVKEETKCSIKPTTAIKSRWTTTMGLAYRSLGVVYGGLATSPLYLYPTINMANAKEEDYLGIFSIIFWTLTLVGVLKYALLILRADHQGEGGTFALYNLVVEHANIAKVDKQLGLGTKNMESTLVKENIIGKLLRRSRVVQTILFLVAMLASAMLIADGVLTPAISVLSATSGLKNVSPYVSQDATVWLTVAILIALFLLQRFGTESVGMLFSPIMITWLLINMGVGVYNIAMYYPSVFKAVSPFYFISFCCRHTTQAWFYLAGTALCVSGVEAMYADLGHFNKRSIQVAFLLGVYPSNLITYAGQTAFFMKQPMACNEEAYYNTIPNILLWPILVISIFAAIVASQSLISACFSLVKQTMEMEQFPRIRIIHTSKTHEGQVYSPHLNYALLFLSSAMVLIFHSGPALGSAYGVTVMTVVFLTTLLFVVVLNVVWKAPFVIVLGFLGFFGVFEGSYLVAVMTGMPRGGWLPYLIAISVACIMWTWIYGRTIKYEYESTNGIKLDELPNLLSSASVKRIPGVVLVYTKRLDFIPGHVHDYILHMCTFHNIAVFVNVRQDCVRSSLADEDVGRFELRHGPMRGVYTCVVTYGYSEAPDWKHSSDQIIHALECFIQDEDEIKEVEMSKCQGGPTHVIGHSVLVSSPKGSPLWKRLLIDTLYRFLHTNCAPSMLFLHANSRPVLPPKLLEIGTVCLV